MHSKHHLLVSLAVGVALVPIVDLSPALVVAASAALGVLVDLDHFLVARYNAGDWRALRYGLANPRTLVVDQAALFGAEEVWPLQRLLSHAVVGGLLVAVLAPLAPDLALLAAVVLYSHVLADLVWDNLRADVNRRRAAATVDGE